MLKPLTSLSIGDWVVLDSPLITRFVGEPWKVTKLASSRVYLEKRQANPNTGLLELTNSKYVTLKSVRYVFSDEASAKAVSDYATTASRQYAHELKVLQERHQAEFDNFLANLPDAP